MLIKIYYILSQYNVYDRMEIIADEHFAPLIDNAYRQGMKLSMGEAQRKLIRLAKEEERQRIIQLLTSQSV